MLIQISAVVIMKNEEKCQFLVEEFVKETKDNLKKMCKKDSSSLLGATITICLKISL